MTDLLIVDNHDSFVHILVDYLRGLGARVTLVEADAIDPATALDDHEAVLISPGPGAPGDAGASVPLVHVAFERGMPLLGVCLGHQAIAEAFGGTVGPAPELMHGMVSQIVHDGTGLFEGMPQPFAAGRYHSLAVTAVPDVLEVTARTDSGTVMGLRHRTAAIVGVQFHPESVLTQHGRRLLSNWLAQIG
ncbi:aminodeoxychorismate/anthranilate synthase component II [Microbacterium protaetiae]|uniref:Aminodeoxychorismate/anthranilate synthase component II n=1 Tax=Microbacterium protaetiae TaxID=2509458 RepID=A0A4P6EBZ5_9MICO|nr:aminodeoxychorismate/anthranilate synthase component II [Microbacterium protaetiae]QAY59725.1 aminodeoxychorismate/anthranilate synthase component II [Microbacterium protaetiae]